MDTAVMAAENISITESFSRVRQALMNGKVIFFGGVEKPIWEYLVLARKDLAYIVSPKKDVVLICEVDDVMMKYLAEKYELSFSIPEGSRLVAAYMSEDGIHQIVARIDRMKEAAEEVMITINDAFSKNHEEGA
jgi:hypothetical protein